MKISKPLYLLGFILLRATFAKTQTAELMQKAEDAMLRSTRFMEDKVSTDGGFVWYYTPDMSRRWGEMEAYKSMIWIQDGGTVSVGHMLLDAYHSTHNEYFYQCAEKAAAALIRGQSKSGGWNYMIDFGGEESIKNWYNTIGKNGWRLEEFQHYYGNDTYDDDVTSDAARFLLRVYLQKLDVKYKPAVDKAINFVLKSQYPNGGWPQRYPLKYDYQKAGHPDYSSFYTFNDNVIWENVNFLIQCYQTLGDKRLLEPIHKGMNFYIISQQNNGAWAQQYNMKMEPAGARTYEPAAYLPRATLWNSLLLLKFYQYTGDRKYLSGIPKAISWLEKVKLPAEMTSNGRYTHSLFVEVGSDKPVFVHRKGSNVKYGYYYTDYNDTHLLAHMQGKGFLDVQKLKDEYTRISTMPLNLVTKDSPLRAPKIKTSVHNRPYYRLSRDSEYEDGDSVSEESVKRVITSLDDQNRWLVKHVMFSNPYIGDGQNKELTDEYASTYVGDKTDTSPYRDASDQLYISTPAYIKNMNLLINFINSVKPTHANLR